MNNGITQHSIRCLLRGEEDYLIPMYQRNYAWGVEEITQLIQDVLDEMPIGQAVSMKPKPYYIGTLVVFQQFIDKGNEKPLYEVIDGQQRLTTLFLLASYFRQQNYNESRDGNDWFRKPSVFFQSRPRSTNALKAVYHGQVKKNKSFQLLTEEYNREIINGYELILELIPKLCKGIEEEFADYLFNQVQIMRVEVPKDTDLNHYFEVMNNRGEQLEKHEVLKSRMMSKLQNSAESATLISCLDQVWEACANMERYVQMGFVTHQRNSLFGEKNWDTLKVDNFDDLKRVLTSNSNERDAEKRCLSNIISQPLPQRCQSQSQNQNKQETIEEAPERFSTVINFPNFLLHVLRLTTGEDIPLDDKQLITAFDEYLLRKSDASERVKRFTFDLLKCKYMYDRYVIKREFAGSNDAWSLKRLKWQRSSGSSDYVNTFSQRVKTTGEDNRRLLMLQSALHVSTPTMVYKHWLNAALNYLYHAKSVTFQSYLERLESIARCFVYDRFLTGQEQADYFEIIYERKGQLRAQSWDDIDDSKLMFGNIANNLVFNYLDYLLWLEFRKVTNVREYEFSFNSSVEHYYPQTPMNGYEQLPESTLNAFGNLCLISHSKNSRLSNLPPGAKRSYYKAGGIDSIKQWLMMKNKVWGKTEILQHQGEMVTKFMQDLSESTLVRNKSSKNSAQGRIRRRAKTSMKPM
ncbi:DUF262 domain-containing protein [Halomonas sp. ATBC28]|uniref:DUF262 domain-containing protein n=1 Tax=Halomonas sp. ATBC28 TaxID=2545264 RepID=UPI00110E2F87|nr:DUF262 domain-containing protein [Halomonas sp. ATBC28]TMU14885.1 DUF262 domain-containing protein [Halomonas sp. ATBC28]